MLRGNRSCSCQKCPNRRCLILRKNHCIRRLSPLLEMTSSPQTNLSRPTISLMKHMSSSLKATASWHPPPVKASGSTRTTHIRRLIKSTDRFQIEERTFSARLESTKPKVGYSKTWKWTAHRSWPPLSALPRMCRRPSPGLASTSKSMCIIRLIQRRAKLMVSKS